MKLKLLNNARTTIYAALIICSSALMIMQGCHKKSRSDMGQALYQQTHNKVYKDITPEGFAPVFEQVLNEQKSHLGNAGVITAFYSANENDPVFVMEHLKNNDLKALADYCQKAGEHGLNPKIFSADKINTLIDKISSKNGVKNTNEAYQAMAELELASANAFLTYANALEFGIISPRKIYARYYTQTKRPDTVSMTAVLHASNMKSFLDSIQPKSQQYIALQKALANGVVAPGMTKEETQRTIAVNLERMRWKNKPNASKYVIVNIPDFRLDVMNNNASVLNMKVCVGQGRNDNNATTLDEYDESDKTDRPFDKETPQLNSMIYAAQVNPIWNIPSSIAGKEIVQHIANDPYYLSNEGIDVYKNGKKVDDPETIDWNSVGGDLSAYSFKQRPGEKNSLGKIKFLFPNKSSVYLHDTPAQAPFQSSMRAVSHGCVRLEKPLDLAKVLFGNDSQQYQTITQDLSEDDPQPQTLSLSHKVPVYITYVTCWADNNNTIQFRKDVYGLDLVLYGHMQKYMNA